MEPSCQRTIAEEVHFTGVGLHSGKKVHLTVKPAPVNHGIRFARTDLPNSPTIPALFRHVVDTSQATVLGSDGVIVSTIEHLMATFAGLGIDNARVELDAYEVPIMDGSAGPFTSLMRRAGITHQRGPRHCFVVEHPIILSENGKSVAVFPSHSFEISCSIDFEHPLLRNQSFSIRVTEETFDKEVSRARTFGFLHEIDLLRRYGFAKGGSLENAVVIDGPNVLNKEGLRFDDECVRHKTLDCLGDFSLLGIPILGRVVTQKSGHTFNHAFLEKFFTEKKCWKIAATA